MNITKVYYLLVSYLLNQSLAQFANVVINKPTWSSPYVTGYNPENANDGYYSFAYNSLKFSSQQGSVASPNYWAVDLEGWFDIKSIFFAADNDLEFTIDNIGLQFRIGDVMDDPWSNPICFTTTNGYSQWIKILKTGDCTGTGSYIFVTSSSPFQQINIVELFAYEYFFIQHNFIGQETSFGSNCSSIMSRTMSLQSNSTICRSGLENNPWIRIKTESLSDFLGYVILTECTVDNCPSSDTYQVDIEFNSGNNLCYNTYSPNTLLNPEFRGDISYHLPDCDGIYETYMNSFKITNNCAQCELGLISFAIFSSCSCWSQTGVTTTQKFYEQIDGMVFDVEISEMFTELDLQIASVQDSTSVNCGDDGTGTDFCERRGLNIKTSLDDENNFEDFQTIYPNLMFFNMTTGMLRVKTNDTSLIRKLKFIGTVYTEPTTDWANIASFTFFINVMPRPIVLACQITRVSVLENYLEFTYKLGSGLKKFSLSQYKQEPDCNKKLIQAEADETQDVSFLFSIQVLSNKTPVLTISEKDESLAGTKAILKITVEFEGGLINSDQYVIVNLLKPDVEKKLQVIQILLKVTSPFPKITEVSDRGLITLNWSMEMKPILNLDALVENQSPAFTVTLEPGSSESAVESLLIKSYEVQSYTNRQMTILIKPENPDQISINPIPDIVRITFIDKNQFQNMTGTAIDPYVSVTATIPLQYGIKKVKGQGFGNTTFEKIMYYFVFFGLSEMVELIISLSLILHTLMISLNYPTIVKDFCDILYPIVTFDVVQSEIWNQYFFDFNNLTNIQPYSYQIGQIGYSSTLSIWNLGDIFYISMLVPALILLLIILSFLLKRCPSQKKCYVRMTAILNSQIKKFFWNRQIRFVHTSFEVITLVALIQLKDLRLSSSYTWQERTCSYFGIFLTIPTILFPFLIVILYCTKMERVKPLPDLDDRMEIEQLIYTYGTVEIDKIQKTAYTKSKHAKFEKKFGTLLQDMNLERNGKFLSIFMSVFELFRLLLISFVLIQFVKYPTIQLVLFIYIQLICLSIELHFKYKEDPIIDFRTLANEIVFMVLNYHMLGMTEFHTMNQKSPFGYGVILLTSITTFINVTIYIIPKILELVLKCKKQRLRRIQKLKLQNLKQAIAKVAPNRQQNEITSQSKLVESLRLKKRNKALINFSGSIQEEIKDQSEISAKRSSILIKSPMISQHSFELEKSQDQNQASQSINQLLVDYDANNEALELANFYLKGGDIKRNMEKTTHATNIKQLTSFDFYEIQMEQEEEQVRANENEDLEQLKMESISDDGLKYFA